MPTIVPADSVSSLSSRSLGDPFVEIAWLSTVTLEQYERLIERDDSFAHAVLRWLAGWFYRNELATAEEDHHLRDISVENFMVKLENGVVLCRMAQLLVAQSRNLSRPILTKCVPTFDFNPWMRAARRSFFARDNVENFTRWCRKFGVHESVLFESDGLVMHQTPRYVLLVLLELCRLCAQLGIDPPSVSEQKESASRKQEERRMQRLEREQKERREAEERQRIEREQELIRAVNEQRIMEERRLEAERLQQMRDEVALLEQQMASLCEAAASSSDSSLEAGNNAGLDSGIGTPTAVCYAEAIALTTCEDLENSQLVESPQGKPFRSRLPVPAKTAVTVSETPSKPLSVLDKKVNSIVNNVLKGAKLHRLSEGKYLINDRQFLVRLLNEKQVMVRVGGGWKSLEEMLQGRQRGSGAGRKLPSRIASDPMATLNSLPKVQTSSGPPATPDQQDNDSPGRDGLWSRLQRRASSASIASSGGRSSLSPRPSSQRSRIPIRQGISPR